MTMLLFYLITWPIVTASMVFILLISLFLMYLYVRKKNILWKNESAAYIHTEAIMDSIDEVPDTVVVINKVGIIIYVNNTSEQMFGYKESELLEKPIYVLLPYECSDIVEKAKKDNHKQEFEVSCKNRQGKEMPILITIARKEKPTGPTFAFVLKDISHRKLGDDTKRVALEILKKDCELLSKGEELLKSGSFHWDMTKVPDEVYYSKGFALILDIPIGQTVTASKIMETIFIEDRDIVNNKMVASMQLHKGWEIECRIIRRNGRKDLIRWNSFPEQTENKKTIKFFGTVQLIKQNV